MARACRLTMTTAEYNALFWRSHAVRASYDCSYMAYALTAMITITGHNLRDGGD